MTTHDYIADVIAGLALFIAAIPFIRAAIRPARLELNLQQYCTLQHYCGRPQLFAFIDVHNAGGRPATFSSLELVLERDDKKAELSAKTYVAQDFVARLGALLGERREMLVYSVTLAPGEHWRELVDAYAYPSHADEKILSELATTMDEQISEKRAQLDDPSSKQLIEVNSELVEQAQAYFNSQFWLNAGNYKVTAIVRYDTNKIAKRVYSFTLWDRNAKELRAVASNYKYGVSHAHSIGSTSSIRLTPIDVA